MSWWIQDEYDTLRRLSSEGESVRAISVALNKSKGQVSGVRYRLGLCVKEANRIRKKATPRKQTDRPKFRADFKRGVSKPVETFVCRDIDVPEADRKLLRDLTQHECRWPYGDGPFSFCARPAAPDHAYCADHKQLAVK